MASAEPWRCQVSMTNLEPILGLRLNLTLAARVRLSASIQCLRHSPPSKAKAKAASIDTRHMKPECALHQMPASGLEANQALAAPGLNPVRQQPPTHSQPLVAYHHRRNTSSCSPLDCTESSCTPPPCCQTPVGHGALPHPSPSSTSATHC